MRFLVLLALVLAIGVVVGTGTAWLAVSGDRVVGPISVGSWTAWPNTTSADADPYTLAHLARSGELSLGPGEGVAFTATTDDTGGSLTSGCVYVVEGSTPSARLWTLTAHRQDGRLMENRAERYGFQSDELLREPDGDFAITLSRDVAPGNWLPVGDVAAYALTLRLYDTPLATGARIAEVEMPRIRRVGCR